MNVNILKAEISSLSVLGTIKSEGILLKLYNTLEALDNNCDSFASAYSEFLYCTLEKCGLSDILREEIFFDSNIFAKESCLKPFDEIGESVRSATEHDIAVLNHIMQNFTPSCILAAAAEHFEEMRGFIYTLPEFAQGGRFPFSDALQLYKFYRQNGYGFFSKTHAFIYRNHSFTAIDRPDSISLSDLKSYEMQKKIIISNTRLFLMGETANNVLLYGDKGTGKSSTVKAVVNEFKNEGLKIIEIRKEDLAEFGNLCEILSKSPFKFIVFLDDISFAKEDDSFGTLKAVIEGGIVERPKNVIIYATSNRRHLVRESFSDREGDEIHARDTIETITSLSDRFGIEITFSVPDKDEYLRIVREMALENGIQTDMEDLYILAERFALLKNGRSPRTARQFIASLAARELN